MKSNAAVLRRDAFHAGLAVLAAGIHPPEALLAAYDAALAAVSTKDRIKIATRVGLFSDALKSGEIPSDAMIELTLSVPARATDPGRIVYNVTIDACWVADDVAVVVDWSDPPLDTEALAARGIAWMALKGLSQFRYIKAHVSAGQVTYHGSPLISEPLA